MSSASDRRARVGAAVDRAWGEGFTLTPRRRPAGDPDARPVADTTRAGFAFVGRFLSRNEDRHARSRATSLQSTKPFDTAAPTLTVVKDADTGTIAEDDLVARQDGGSVFTVVRVRDGDFGRLVLMLRSGPR